MPQFVLGRLRRLVLKQLFKASDFVKASNLSRRVWTEVEFSSSSSSSPAVLLDDALRQIPPFDRIECGMVLVLRRHIQPEKDDFFDDTPQSYSPIDGQPDYLSDYFFSNPRTKRHHYLSDYFFPNSRPKRRRSSDGDDADSLPSNLSSIFPDFVTLPQTHTKVAVIDLSTLLSPVELDEVHNHHPRFQKPVLFLRPDDPITVDAVLSLWRLKGMVMHDK